ncbi:uncharacterized protein LOC111271515 [Varroa jacobsoni]|uniref:uncharacterized protein LOC111271515 n=1 Tax=Varroa jacobsoni TaxID=62625 RepID=UPI000BF62CBB|nr:uncharacterized protein LOC111271515 [Varroa jacobsoni]
MRTLFTKGPYAPSVVHQVTCVLRNSNWKFDNSKTSALPPTSSCGRILPKMAFEHKRSGYYLAGNLQMSIALTLLSGLLAADVELCSQRHLENCSDSLYVLTRKNHEFVVPETESALIAHCEKQTAAEECLRERVDICDTGITKGMSRALFDDNHDEFSRRCDPTSKEYTDFLSIAPCINTISGELYGCMVGMLTNLSNAIHVKTFRKKVDHGCCAYKRFEKCVLDIAVDRCGSETQAFFDDYLKQTVRETVTLLCSADYELCTTLKPVELPKKLNIEYDEPQSIFSVIHYILGVIQAKE